VFRDDSHDRGKGRDPPRLVSAWVTIDAMFRKRREATIRRDHARAACAVVPASEMWIRPLPGNSTRGFPGRPDIDPKRRSSSSGGVMRSVLRLFADARMMRSRRTASGGTDHRHLSRLSRRVGAKIVASVGPGLG
jgi:hypothetical protein